MRRRSVQVVFAVFLAMLLFSGGFVLGQSDAAPFELFGVEAATPSDAEVAFRPFWETWRLVQDEYFDQPLDDIKLAEGAIEGMLATLGDPNTRYLSPDQEGAARQAIDGNIEGIGAEVTMEDGAIMIVSPYAGSPAEEAGLQQGDLIRQANGIDLTGMDVSEAAAIVRGPAGTLVKLLIERDGELFEVEVKRDVIRLPSVIGEILEQDIAYVRLSRFGNNTVEELADVLDDLLASNPTGIILDLRSNPGGTLNTAVDVAGQFLDEGPILIERFGNGRERVHSAETGGSAQDVPLVILIDAGSASASEVLAGAVSERGRGILIGDTSFGKGTVQSWQRLSNGGGVRITIARWLTPKENWVHGQGLEPDFVITNSVDEAGEFKDNQLAAAIDFLQGRPVMENEVDDGAS
jgi:carboxyl-terminal processing protease